LMPVDRGVVSVVHGRVGDMSGCRNVDRVGGMRNLDRVGDMPGSGEDHPVLETRSRPEERRDEALLVASRLMRVCPSQGSSPLAKHG
jgi:hypothetical protein